MFITDMMRCRLKVKISGVELPIIMLRVSIIEQFLQLFCLIFGSKGQRNKFSLCEQALGKLLRTELLSNEVTVCSVKLDTCRSQ